MFLELWP